MARTVAQIEQDILNQVSLKLKEYTQYIVKVLNNNTDVVNAVNSEVVKQLTGLNVIVSKVGSMIPPADTDPVNDPNSPIPDMSFFLNTTDKTLKFWHNNAWHALINFSTLMNNLADIDLGNVNVGTANADRMVRVKADGGLEYVETTDITYTMDDGTTVNGKFING